MRAQEKAKNRRCEANSYKVAEGGKGSPEDSSDEDRKKKKQKNKGSGKDDEYNDLLNKLDRLLKGKENDQHAKKNSNPSQEQREKENRQESKSGNKNSSKPQGQETTTSGIGRTTTTQRRKKKGDPGDSSSDDDDNKWFKNYWMEEQKRRDRERRKEKNKRSQERDRLKEDLEQLTKVVAGLTTETVRLKQENKKLKEEEKEETPPDDSTDSDSEEGEDDNEPENPDDSDEDEKPTGKKNRKGKAKTYYGQRPWYQQNSAKGLGTRFFQEMIPNVDVAASNLKSGEKLKFAEAVDQFLQIPNVNETVLFQIIRAKLGKYATTTWFDPEYANLPKKKRPRSFLEAFKKKWMRLMDCDDYNKLIQGFHFENLSDAVQAGLQFEQKCLPYMELADSPETRKTAERMKVSKFRKILGGTLMAQMLNIHPKPFESVSEMISVIKDLNDKLGITHRAQPAEPPFHVMAMASDLGERDNESRSSQEEKIVAAFTTPDQGNNNNGTHPKKILGIEKGWAGWNKIAETAKMAATSSDPDPGYNSNGGNNNGGWNGKNNKKRNWNNGNNGGQVVNQNQSGSTPVQSQQQQQQQQQQPHPPQQPQFQRPPQNQVQHKQNFNNGIQFVPAGNNTANSHKSNGGNGNTTVTSDTTQTSGQTGDSQRSCFHCGDLKHIAKDCEIWKKHQRQKRARMICTTCNKYGHWAKYCRENRDENDPNGHLPPDQRWPVSTGKPVTNSTENPNQTGN